MRYMCMRGCGGVSRKKGDVSPNYFGACLICDEDFYEFELDKITETEFLKEYLKCIGVLYY